MKNDSGIKSATGLTGSGSRDWIMQRISAAILAVYAIVLVVFFLMHGNVDYNQWVSFMMSLPMRLLSMLAILALVAHAWVGMWIVLTDYVKSAGVRIVLQALIITAILAFLFWGFMIFFSLGFRV